MAKRAWRKRKLKWREVVTPRKADGFWVFWGLAFGMFALIIWLQVVEQPSAHSLENRDEVRITGADTRIIDIPDIVITSCSALQLNYEESTPALEALRTRLHNLGASQRKGIVLLLNMMSYAMDHTVCQEDYLLGIDVAGVPVYRLTVDNRVLPTAAQNRGFTTRGRD